MFGCHSKFKISLLLWLECFVKNINKIFLVLLFLLFSLINNFIKKYLERKEYLLLPILFYYTF